MSQVLLDTHALLFVLVEPKRLSRRARALVEDRSVDLYVSPVSALEIAQKARLGKLGRHRQFSKGSVDTCVRLAPPIWN